VRRTALDRLLAISTNSIIELSRKELGVGVVATVLAEVIRGRDADAGVFARLRRERIHAHALDSRVGVRGPATWARACRL
jgi:hypothetical protein